MPLGEPVASSDYTPVGATGIITRINWGKMPTATVRGHVVEYEEITIGNDKVVILAVIPGVKSQFVVAQSLRVLENGSFSGYRTRKEALDAIEILKS